MDESPLAFTNFTSAKAKVMRSGWLSVVRLVRVLDYCKSNPQISLKLLHFDCAQWRIQGGGRPLLTVTIFA